MMKSKPVVIVGILGISMVLNACSLVYKEGSEKDPLLDVYDNSESDGISEDSNMLKDFNPALLEDGKFYVRHMNNECEEVFIGNATFDDATEYSSDDRVIWFKDDIENIPTLKPGESLIYYSTEAFDEDFILERFEDFGYSVGLRGITITKSGRLKISTDEDDKTTYPESDADAILDSMNDYLIIDKVGNQKILEDKYANGLVTTPGTLNRCGVYTAIQFNDNKDASEHYLDFTMYDGTIRKEYKLKTDVRIMGSMEMEPNPPYEYEYKDVIRFNLSELNLNSGYYLINGAGLFRYITATDDALGIDNINFNLPNNDADYSDIEETVDVLDSQDKVDNEKPSTSSSMTTLGSDKNESDEYSSFTLYSSGAISVRVTFTSTMSDQHIEGKLVTPNGTKYKMSQNNDGSLSIDLSDAARGEYRIYYTNLKNAIPKVSVQ